MQDQSTINFSKPLDLHYPKALRTPNTPLPTLIKVQCFQNNIFCAYSNGNIILFKANSTDRTYSYSNKFTPYQNTQVIDIDYFDSDTIVTCTHNQISLFNLTKGKSMPIYGHEESVMAISAHPISPYVVSMSNNLVTFDLRTRLPINVNFITPQSYDVQFFPDGKQYLLSGQPCRIGRTKWIRTLLNGISKPSLNSKFVLTNEMNGRMSLWDWRQSQQVVCLTGLKNFATYNQPQYVVKNGMIKQISILQDNGYLTQYDILKQKRTSTKLLDVGTNDNWKMVTRIVQGTTKTFICYQHSKAIVKIFQV